MPLAGQQIHQRCVHPGPLVLGTNPLNSPTPTADRDRQFCYSHVESGVGVRAFLPDSACRHAARTIVSEDSGWPSLMSSAHRTLLNRPPPFIESATSKSPTKPSGVRC